MGFSTLSKGCAAPGRPALRKRSLVALCDAIGPQQVLSQMSVSRSPGVAWHAPVMLPAGAESAVGRSTVETGPPNVRLGRSNDDFGAGLTTERCSRGLCHAHTRTRQTRCIQTSAQA